MKKIVTLYRIFKKGATIILITFCKLMENLAENLRRIYEQTEKTNIFFAKSIVTGLKIW